MTPGGTGTKRKRPDRTYSQDGSGADQPAAKSPRGSRFPSNAQGNSHSQGRNRDGGGRGGRDNNRGGHRSAHSPTNATFRSASNSNPQVNIPIQAPPAPTQTLPSPAAIKQPAIDNADALQPIPQIPSFRHYATITEEMVKTWQDQGKTMILEQALRAKNSQDHIKLGCIFQEIIFSGLDGRLTLPEAGKTIKQIINSGSADGAQDTFDQETAEAFLDTVAISCSNDTKNLRLRQILLATEIPSDTIVMILGDDMLEAQKLVRPNWTRMTIKHQTNALYRQANYNLLREETEGYSKLVTELFTTVENESSTDEVARVSFERVKAMIGAFNLDVGRVLDVTLDVFAAILVRHSTFLVKFLQLSTWWPREILSEGRHTANSARVTGKSGIHSSISSNSISDTQCERDEIFWARVKEVGLKAFFELGTRRAEEADLEAILPASSGDVENNKNKDGTTTTKTTTPKTDILRSWIEETGTLPPQGNEDAAQILGFKLRFYNSAARDEDDNLPSNLIYLSALLIKIGFISLLDLYPHLWPSDEDMKAVESKLSAEKEEREKDRKPGGKNALELAGALVDDTLPPPPRRLPEPAAKSAAPTNDAPEPSASQDKPVVEVKQLPDPVEQKIQLLRSLLCIGAIPEALFMLGQFPWLIDLVPELPEHINRIVHQSLSLVYQQLRPLQDYDGIQEPEKYADPEQAAAQKGYVQLATIAPRKVMKWAQIDKVDGPDGVDYRFYWEQWTNNVPLCRDIDDVFLLCNTFLNLSGFKIGQDPLLMAKLSRIGLYSLETDTSEENKSRWMALCKRLLVPALSLAGRNSSTVAEVWRLLKRFPATTRYNIYFEWYLGQTSRNKDILGAFNYSQAETKDVLKKISKTNTRPMARLLAKAAVASPGKVFEVIIKQIESYDNLIGVVVEASRFFTELGYDVLVWSLINALGKARSRVQKDGLLTSQWLSKLAGFCGTVFKKYPVMNPIPVLQYVTNQLLNHNSTDLVVLEHLIKQMAGITQDASFDNSKIIAMCGGPVLRAKTMASLDDERSDPTKQNSTKRLMKALITSNLTGALLIAISQERQSCIFNVDEADAYLKLLGNFFDEIHRVLTQYVDLIQTNLDNTEFRTLIPTLAELVGQYGIEPAVAFWIWRPLIAADIAVYDKTALEKNTITDTTANSTDIKDIEMTDGEKSTIDPEIEKAESENAADTDVAMVGESTDNTGVDETRPGHPVIQELIGSVRPVLPAATFDMISDLFYFTFWRLSPYDLHIPETYQEESKRLTAKIEQLKKERGGTSIDVRNREMQRKQLTEQNTKIAAELKDHLTAYQRTKVALAKEKDKWFDLGTGKWQDLNLAILEHCFIPRMVLSSVDSYFVFKMLKVLHSMGAKNFRTMGLLDCFFDGKRLLPLIFSCTQKEAENVARFISEILKDLKKWHSNKDLYEKEAFGAKRDLPGFKKNLRDADSFMDYESFRTLLAKWHKNLYDAIRESLKSPEYMHIKNAILISKEVAESFPAIDWMGRNIEEAVKHVNTNDERGDLKMLSLALLGMLKSKSGKWVTTPVFARHKQGQVNGPPSTKAISAPAKSPVPVRSPADTPQSSHNNALNAKAPEFVPGAISIDPTKKRDARGEAEDGEIRTPTTAKLALTPSNLTQDSQQGSENNNTLSGTDKAPLPPPSSTRAINGNAADRHDEKANDKIGDKVNDKTNAQLPPRPLTQSRPDLMSRTHQSRQPEPPRNHGLPSRSDFSDPQRSSNPRPPEWMPDRGPTRTSNDPRDADYRRSDRPGDSSRLSDTDYRAPNRPYDRPHHNDREAQNSNWNGDRNSMSRPHDDRGSTLHSRAPIKDEKNDRPQRDTPPADSRDRYREPETHESRSRENSRAPRSSAPIHSDRTTLLKTAQEQDRSHHGGPSDRRREAERSEHHGPPPSRASRGSSPVRRNEDSTSRSDHKRYDDRQVVDTRRPPEQPPVRTRHDDPRQSYPSRSDYHGDSMQTSYDERTRGDTRNSHSVRQDQNNNWHKQDSRPPPRPDLGYGRLNQEPPAGPRTNSNPNATPVSPRQTRSNSLQQAHNESRNRAPSIPPPASGGPIGGRDPKRAVSNYTKPPPITTTTTSSTTISPSPDTAGIHPDRLRALQGANNPEDSNNSTQGRSLPSQAPAGPRSTMPETSNLPNTFEGGRGRGDKRFAQLNTVLSQTNGSSAPERPPQGPITRGRGEQANENLPPAYSNSKDVPTPTSAGPRQDQFPNRGPPANSSRNSDEASGRRSLRSADDRPMSRSQDGYSHNDNLRTKAGYNNPRENSMRPPNGDMRDSRTRGSGPFPQTPPVHNHQDRERRPARDNMQGPNDRSNGRRDSGREEWSGGDQQRSGQSRRDHQQQEGGGSGRKRGRGNEEMYEHGPAAYDHSKRPRRG